MALVFASAAAGLTLLHLGTRRLRALPCWHINVAPHERKWWTGGSFVPLLVGATAADGEAFEFSVLVDPALKRSARRALRHDLRSVARALPPRALRRAAAACHIWCSHDNGGGGAEVHWIEKPFADPCGDVAPRPFALEINCWATYATGLLAREGVLCHELAHVFNATIGREHREIVELFNRCERSGVYDSVELLDGSPPQRAYGLTNHLELFASLSVPLFGGTNDYFPFTRAQLKATDRSAYDDLIRVWGSHGDAVEQHIARLEAVGLRAYDTAPTAKRAARDRSVAGAGDNSEFCLSNV